MGTAIGHANVRDKQTSINSYEFMTMKSICRYKTFRVGYFDKKTFFAPFVHYLHVKNCVLYRYYSRK